MAQSRAILPKARSLAKPMRSIITNTLNAQAKAIKVDFGVTTQTWEHDAPMTISSPSTYTREITVNDPIYAMLNAGTRAHDITPKPGRFLVFRTPFRAKTVPNEIMSERGSRGNATVWSRGVHHPGTKARNWDRVIGKKWRERIGDTFQRAIDSAVR